MLKKSPERRTISFYFSSWQPVLMDSVFDIKRSELDFERAQKNDKSIQRLYKFGIALSSKEKFPIDELEFVLRGNTSCHDIL